MPSTPNASEISIEFLFSSPLGETEEKDLFGFFNEIASLPKTQVFVDTFKDLYVGKVPKGLLLFKPLAEIEKSNGWFKIRKTTDVQYLYPQVYAYAVTIVTFNSLAVSSKLYDYVYFKIKRGKVLLNKDKKEIVLVPHDKSMSREELSTIIL